MVNGNERELRKERKDLFKMWILTARSEKRFKHSTAANNGGCGSCDGHLCNLMFFGYFRVET